MEWTELTPRKVEHVLQESPPPEDQENADLTWSPETIKDIEKSEVDLYLRFASTACIPGGGCDIEVALDVLFKCHGDIRQATSYLLSRDIEGQTIWTLNEKHSFEEAFARYPEDFPSISRELRTKTVEECVKFYYLGFQQPLHPRHIQAPVQPSKPQVQLAPQQTPEPQEQQAGLLLLPPPPPSSLPQLQQQPQIQPQSQPTEVFPCKVCGREFLKIKSRSAHMKRHKNERLYGHSESQN